MNHCKLAGLIVLLISCNQEKDLRDQSAAEIDKADRAMSALASKEGFNKALLQFADEKVVKPLEGRLPIIGKNSLQEPWANAGATSISWEPFRVEAARSGDMGYSLGYWKNVKPDTTLYGFYYTVWKKQKDGVWKFVLDGGTSTPPRAEK